MTVIIDNLDATVLASNGATTTIPPRFNVTAADTPDTDGYQIRGPYCEEHWLAFIGPIAYLLARHIDDTLANHPKGVVVTDKIAAQLGVDPRHILSAVKRLKRYALADYSERDALVTLARRWPRVPDAIQHDPHRAALLAIDDDIA